MPGHKHAGAIDSVHLAATASRVCTKVYVRKTIFYRRLRHGGDQYVRVEHVHINEGAQAVIGNVLPHERGRAQLPEAQIIRGDHEKERGS